MIEAVCELKCDSCQTTLTYTRRIYGPIPPSIAEHIRTEARELGWISINPVGQPEIRDLCPDCFQSPPETQQVKTP